MAGQMDGRIGLVCLHQTGRMALQVLGRVSNCGLEVRLRKEIGKRLQEKSVFGQCTVFR